MSTSSISSNDSKSVDIDVVRQLLKFDSSFNSVDIAHQLDTALRVRHDLWVMKLDYEIMNSEKLVLEEFKEKKTPDIFCKEVETGKTMICEVTFSLDSSILSIKRAKYEGMADKIYLSTPTVHDFEEHWFPELVSYKKRFVAETNMLFRDFNLMVDKHGISTESFKDHQILQQNKESQDPLVWPNCNTYKSKTLKMSAKLTSNFVDPAEFEENFGKLCETVKHLVKDPEIRSHYELQTVSNDSFSKGFNMSRDNITSDYEIVTDYKPTMMFFSPLSKQDNLLDGIILPFNSEQELIENQLDIISKMKNELSDLISGVDIVLKDKLEKNIFLTGIPNEDGDPVKLKNLYKKEKKNFQHEEEMNVKKGTKYEKPVAFMSFLEFCQTQLDEKEKTRKFFVQGKKCIKLPVRDHRFNHETINFLKKSKTGMSAAEYIEDKLEKKRRAEESTRCMKSVDPLQYNNQIEKFYDNLTRECSPDVPSDFTNMLYEVGSDNHVFTKLKEDTLYDFQAYLGILGNTNLLRYASTQKHHIEQLLHIQNLTLQKGCFSFFNSGCKEVLYIIQHGHQNKGRDVGRAYIIVSFGQLKEFEKDIYGFVHSEEVNYKRKKTTLHWTNWRRLPSQRLTFHSDQIYSALSTVSAFYFRRLDLFRAGVLDWKTLCKEVRSAFATRITISLSHSQSTAELLSDIRYLYMNAFSTHANVKEFILDKFVRPIRTVYDAHLLNTVPLFDNVRQQFETGGVKIAISNFVEGKRDERTTGGTIYLKSVLHPNVILRDIQDLLDDMFLYVHTNKEPASPYHEFIKAFNVIIKFQKIYDSHSESEKNGNYPGYESLKEFLIRDDKVGFWDVATSVAGCLISDKLSKDNIEGKIVSVLKRDTILDMSSTKSIIPERERVYQTETLEDLIPKHLKKKKKILWELIGKEEAPFQKTIYTERLTKSDKLIVLGGTNRSKVHDSTIDLHTRFGFYRSLDIARWNIEHNRSRVVTDICIKAQYGAKREFYVVNHGAKAMARVLEKGYRVVCEHLEEEMISISGDQKMYNIQTLLDKAMLSSGRRAKNTFFCNGDCTKWSAAETMECLMTFNRAMKGCVGVEFSEYCDEVLSAWATKSIEIPKDLQKNVFFKKQGITEYLEKDNFLSSQNFLQGMFNYLSSAKAVGCSELLRNTWKTLNPESTLTFYHMEHSDDYAFIVLSDTIQEFEEFKLMHRVLMRLCGINDSTKKTNCQQFLLEFISLLSFNGMMTYPHIKKIKETGLNVGCLGYSSDIQTTCSRVGESVRVGIPLNVAYVMQRIQNVRIGEAYGLFSANSVIIDQPISNIPTELWGFPDCWPVLYTLTKGNPNNYRLMHHGTNATKAQLNKLFWLKQVQSFKTDSEVNDVDYTNATSLYHPSYNYLTQSKLLTQIRKICGYTFEQALSYWDNHFFDLYLKPKDSARFRDWLLSKYFQKSFGEAYMRQSRSFMQLRLSAFVNSECLSIDINRDMFDTVFNNDVNLEKIMTMREYRIWFDKLSLKTEVVNSKPETFIASQEVSTYSFDPSIILIYDLLKTASIERSGRIFTTTKAYREPSKKFEYTTRSDPIKILQYLYQPDDFFLDGYKLHDVNTFLSDVSKVRSLAKLYNIVTPEDFKKSVYKRVIIEHLTGSKGTGKPLLLKFNPENDVINTVVKMMECHTSSTQYYKLEIGISDQLISRTFESDKETGMYISGSSLSENWYEKTPEILGDIGLLLFYLKDEPKKVIMSVLDQVTLKLSGKSFKDVLTTMVSMLESDALVISNNLEQLLCALDDYYLNSPIMLDKYLKKKLSYSYRYFKNTPTVDMTTIDLKFMGERFKLIFHETLGKAGHNLTVYTSSKRINIFGWAYLVGLRLMSAISVGEYIKRTAKHPTDSLPNTTPLTIMTGQNIYKNRITGKLTLKPDNEIDLIVPIVLVPDLYISDNLDVEILHQLPKFDIRNFSVYTGRSKVYTINPFQLKQMDMWDISAVVKGIPFKLFSVNKNMERLLKGETLRIPKDFLFTDVLEKTINNFVKNFKLELKVIHLTLTSEQTAKNILKIKDKLLTNSGRFTRESLGMETDRRTLQERIQESLNREENSILDLPQEEEEMRFLDIAKKYEEYCFYVNIPCKCLENFDYKSDFIYLDKKNSIDSNPLYSIVNLTCTGYETESYIVQEILQLEGSIKAFMETTYLNNPTTMISTFENKIEIKASQDTNYRRFLHIDALTDFNFVVPHDVPIGCDTCKLCTIGDIETELKLGATLEELEGNLEEYACENCDKSKSTGESSHSEEKQEQQEDETVEYLGYLEHDAGEDFDWIIKVRQGCSECNLYKLGDITTQLKYAPKDELLASLNEYKCNACEGKQIQDNTDDSVKNVSDIPKETAPSFEINIPTKIGTIHTKFQLWEVFTKILENNKNIFIFFNFMEEMIEFISESFKHLNNEFYIRKYLPKNVIRKEWDAEEYYIDEFELKSEYKFLLSLYTVLQVEEIKQEIESKTNIKETSDKAKVAKEIYQINKDVVSRILSKRIKNFKDMNYSNIMKDEQFQFPTHVLLQDEQYIETDVSNMDNDDEDLFEEQNYRLVSDLGQHTTNVLDEKSYDVRHIPYTVESAFSKVKEARQQCVKSYVIGQTQYDKLSRTIKLHILKRLNDMIADNCIPTELQDGLKKFLFESFNRLKLSRTTQGFKSLSIDIIDNKLVYRRIREVNDVTVHAGIHNLSRISGIEILPLNYGTFEVHVPLNENALNEAFESLDAILLDTLDRQSCLYKFVKEKIEETVFLRDLDQVA